MNEDEKKDLREELRRLLADTDALEKQWRDLPEELKAANPDLGKWFSGKPPTKH